MVVKVQGRSRTDASWARINRIAIVLPPLTAIHLHDAPPHLPAHSTYHCLNSIPTYSFIPMPNKYQRLPTSDTPSSLLPYTPYKSESDLFEDDSNDVELNGSISPRSPTISYNDNPRTRETREAIRAFHADPRFHPPQPSVYARAGLLMFMFTMFWLAYAMRKAIWLDFGMGEMKVYEKNELEILKEDDLES
jgi:hypothetical protein